MECHGTGTALGDPIEVQSIAEARGSGVEPLLLGSCKANWGHAETAAGILGVLKCLLSMEMLHLNKQIHLVSLNKHIGVELMESIGAVVPLETVSLKETDDQIVAGVSSFAFSGTNAHLVIQRAPCERTYLPASLPDSVIVSARNKAALGRMLREMGNVLREGWTSSRALLSLSRTQFSVKMTVSTLFTLDKQLVAQFDALGQPDYECVVRGPVPTYRFERKSYWIPSPSSIGFAPVLSKAPCYVQGVGSRFADAYNADQYWDLLALGRDTVSVVPEDRFDWTSFYDGGGSEGKSVSKWGSFLSNVWHFDASFFSISPRQANVMDPNARLLLECSWEAVSSSGQELVALQAGRVGVFIGLAGSDYYEALQKKPLDDGARQFVNVSNFESATAGRISYFFGFSGECLAVDTACSSALVALALSCKFLSSDENSTAALTGASGTVLGKEHSINFSKAGMLSADGRCKTFDAKANGYVRGEGCAVFFVSKQESQHCIRGFAINQVNKPKKRNQKKKTF